MKKIILLLFISLISSLGYAQKERVLLLSMQDGTSVTFFLKEKPRVTFSGEMLEIISEASQANVKRSEVREIKFVMQEDPETAIDEAKASENVGIDNEMIVIENIEQGSVVKVLTIDGRIVATEAADENNSVRISLASLSAGIYLLNYNDTTIKFIKR